jgi:hypothetical protein
MNKHTRKRLKRLKINQTIEIEPNLIVRRAVGGYLYEYYLEHGNCIKLNHVVFVPELSLIEKLLS